MVVRENKDRHSLDTVTLKCSPLPIYPQLFLGAPTVYTPIYCKSLGLHKLLWSLNTLCWGKIAKIWQKSRKPVLRTRSAVHGTLHGQSVGILPPLFRVLIKGYKVHPAPSFPCSHQRLESTSFPLCSVFSSKVTKYILGFYFFRFSLFHFCKHFIFFHRIHELGTFFFFERMLYFQSNTFHVRSCWWATSF